MSIYDLIRKRQSDRKYDPDRKVSREVIERIIEAGMLAPSACNSQPWKFVVVEEESTRLEVAHATTSVATGTMNKFVASAPVLIVIVEESVNIASRIGGWLLNQHFAHLDIGIAAENMVLAATEEGLGSCMIGWCDEKRVRKALDIPRGKRIPLIIALGYSLEGPKKKVRKPIDKVVSYNKY
ncbi:nitroreductase family protein [Porphyromonas sp.]|uniref:nitroreductase family protein n=1 Tax=Porphyromonas sp. TaxID=1924944 RepID=UPI0026DDBF45|nr:nitroreductase family protein [Porphyromonas sp.]MDO4695387.1 nitroreductase family protein [Porphyromonas sp.]MDO4770486.1 nitroreductase family protein [Porphyromonas sp.]